MQLNLRPVSAGQPRASSHQWTRKRQNRSPRPMEAPSRRSECLADILRGGPALPRTKQATISCVVTDAGGGNVRSAVGFQQESGSSQQTMTPKKGNLTSISPQWEWRCGPRSMLQQVQNLSVSGPAPKSLTLPAAFGGSLKLTAQGGCGYKATGGSVLVDPSASSWAATWRA